MCLNNQNVNEHSNSYQRVPSEVSSDFDYRDVQPLQRRSRFVYILTTTFLMLLSASLGFTAAKIFPNLDSHTLNSGLQIVKPVGVQPRVKIDTIARTFEHNSNFTLPPPVGPNSGSQSEPIWDSLVPSKFYLSRKSASVINHLTIPHFHQIIPMHMTKSITPAPSEGLGYISHPTLPSTSIPTVFHQLHCLYTIRRAYYANQDLLDTLLRHPAPSSSAAEPELQRFDLGKNRTYHVGHCFDFLRQGLTCSADSTLEPAVDEEHEFLGSGFPRQCRDFEALKSIAETYRAFEYEGFLAEGVDVHGRHSHGR